MSLQILHIGSFSGNIGDNINHFGTRQSLIELLEKRGGASYTELEIREFYRGHRRWDSELVEYLNTFDLCIIGGGNYFELWVEKSPSGTSVELEPELLKKVTTPTVFHALGCDIGQGCSQANAEKFEAFCRVLADKPQQFYVSLRNDGSSATWDRVIGREVLDPDWCPDCGFLYSSPNKLDGSGGVGLNIAGDRLDVRYGYVGLENFLNKLAGFLSMEACAGRPIYFFTHIFRDVQLVARILDMLPDRVVREQVTVAPYQQGLAGAATVFGYYHACDYVLANRFHSNIYALANGVPVFPLVNYPQIDYFYHELGLKNRPLDLRRDDWSAWFDGGSRESIELTDMRHAQCETVSGLKTQIKGYFTRLDDWFDTIKLGTRT